ncbi:hypothetical protein DSO57_1008513 [Entomophthora muscae]|uniref:Uncharacterized protein n=1 Tax=Entomophthora muscae TaxID=34485 RepID=A0ACC2TI40_9FUNG|nr:hypothetical protein DSO57_1008513 [Entomophthora muscae]
MLRSLIFGVLILGVTAQSNQASEVEIIESQGAKVRFECNTQKLGTSEKKAKARHAVKLAAELMENVIAFNSQIKIKLDYILLCEGKENCRPKYFGEATASYSYFVLENEQFKLYPLALLKQYPEFINMNHTRMSDIDVKIRITLDTEPYFPSDYPTKISRNQFDFIDTLLHEVVHGLGMQSKLWLHTIDYEQFTGQLPNFIVVPPPFDLHVYDTHTNQTVGTSLSNLAPLSTPNRRQKFDHLLSAFQGGRRLYFRSIRGKNITLDPQYVLSHVAPEYSKTLDELMTSFGMVGSSFTDFIFKFPNWHTSPFGPATLDILATIGYQLKVPDPYKSLQYYYQYKETHNGEDPPSLPAYQPNQ